MTTIRNACGYAVQGVELSHPNRALFQIDILILPLIAILIKLISMRMIDLIKPVFDLFYPRLCIICSVPLVEQENFLCIECLQKLPKTNYHPCVDNPATEGFSGKVPIRRANAFLYYNKEGVAQKLIAHFKYKGNVRLGKWLGKTVADELVKSRFFEGIDLIIPVPLHAKKLKKRGFNQAEVLAQEISKKLQIPLNTTLLYRTKANSSQTQKNVFDRWRNTQNIFALRNHTDFNNKHVLLIDDVLTTGATLEACAHTLLQIKGIQISILTLAIT